MAPGAVEVLYKCSVISPDHLYCRFLTVFFFFFFKLVRLKILNMFHLIQS